MISESVDRGVFSAVVSHWARWRLGRREGRLAFLPAFRPPPRRQSRARRRRDRPRPPASARRPGAVSPRPASRRPPRSETPRRRVTALIRSYSDRELREAEGGPDIVCLALTYHA